MASLISLLAEPMLRMAYGAPLEKLTDASAPDRAGETCSQRGLVLVADGVGGFDLCGTALRYVLGAEKLPYAFQQIPWGHGLGRWFADLTDVANRDEQARRVAESVRRYRIARPFDPIYMVAKSGGSGVIVKALELLDDHQIERAVLLAPAISSDYDLSRALRAVRSEIVVFWSPLDIIILGAGTRLLGTVDRIKAASAGLVSFRARASGRQGDNNGEQYDKLRQIRWRLRMAFSGHMGGHFGPDSPVFLRKYVVPLLRVEEGAGC